MTRKVHISINKKGLNCKNTIEVHINNDIKRRILH